MTKYKIVLTLLLAVLAAVSAVVVTGVLDINKNNGGDQSTQPGETAAPSQTARPGYADVFVTDANVKLPLIKTDIEGYYYTMDKQGGVKFYFAQDGVITQIPETEAYEVKAVCSAQTLTAMVHILKTDERTYGCGLFTNVLYPDVNYYAYAFFRVTDMFRSYRDARTGTNYYNRGSLLLLVDTVSTRFYSNEKIYSEAFVLNEDHTTSLFLSNDQRTPGMDGVDRKDYKMFTDDILDQNEDSNVLFFSARNYADYDSETGGRADIMTSGGSGTNIDNVRYVLDVNSLYFQRIGKNVFFFRANETGGFDLKAYDNANEAVTVASFEGSLQSDYLRSGNYLLRKANGAVYDLAALMEAYNASGAVKEKAPVSCSLDYSVCPAGFTADWFTVSGNGRYCAVRGESADASVSLLLTDTVNNKTTVSTDVMFRLVANVNLLNDGTVIVSVVTSKTDEGDYVYAQLTCKLG